MGDCGLILRRLLYSKRFLSGSRLYVLLRVAQFAAQNCLIIVATNSPECCDSTSLSYILEALKVEEPPMTN